MKNLEKYRTKELIEELERREGVNRTTVEPYKDTTIKINGPAVVLVVID